MAIPAIPLITEVLTGPDTTTGTTMAIMTGTTGMPLLTDTGTWTAGTITDMPLLQTPAIRDLKHPIITIRDTGAEQPTAKVQVLLHKGMLQEG